MKKMNQNFCLMGDMMVVQNLRSRFRDRMFAMALLLTMFSVSCPAFVAAQTDSSDDAASQAEFEFSEYPIAILPFKTRGKDVDGMGEKVSDLMFAKLVVDPTLYLVDREDLAKILSEAELNISGLVDPNAATKIGNLTGAKLLVTGSVFQVDDSIYVVSKIIGTETSRVVGASAKGAAEGKLADTVEVLGKEILASIKKNSDSLVAKPVKIETRIESIKRQLKGKELPKIFVAITEEHIGSSTIDPAAQTEMVKMLRDCGFEVIDSEEGNKSQAEVLIQGEGFSEFATRTGNLISVKCRLEIKAVDPESDQVIVADRQTRLAVDLTEQIAGKQALQDAAVDIAERLIPKIVAEDK